MSNDLPTGWQEVRLGEVGKIITGKTPSSKSKEFWGDDINFITPSDMKQDSKYITCTARHLSLLSLDKMKNLVLPENTVITSCIGSDMGKSYISKSISITNQQINSIIVNKEFNVDFILYALKIKQNFLRKLATGGSTMPILNKSDFSNIFISIPKEIDEQKRIAKVLSALDDKIENNRQMNATLEAMAQTIFKAWFVDFLPVSELQRFNNGNSKYTSKAEIAKALYMDEATLDLFPSTFDQNGLPLGWEVKKLGDTKQARIIGSGIDSFENEKIYLATADVDSTNIVNQTTKITYDDRPSRANMQPIYNSIWFAKMKDTRKLLMFGEKCDISSHILSTGFAGIQTTTENHFYLWCFIQSNDFDKVKNNLSNGAVQIGVNNTAIKQIDFILPNNNILIQFNKIAEPMFNKIKQNQKENQTLTKIRDTLLPQLLSGKLRIADVENFIKD